MLALILSFLPIAILLSYFDYTNEREIPGSVIILTLLFFFVWGFIITPTILGVLTATGIGLITYYTYKAHKSLGLADVIIFTFLSLYSPSLTVISIILALVLVLAYLLLFKPERRYTPLLPPFTIALVVTTISFYIFGLAI